MQIDKQLLLSHAATIGKLEEELSQIFGKPLSIMLVDRKPDFPVYIPKVETIISHVAQSCEVEEKELLGRSRIRSLTDARAIAIKIVRQLHPELSLNKIGNHFNRDHTTVMHALEAFENLYSTAADFRRRYDYIKQTLLNQNQTPTT